MEPITNPKLASVCYHHASKGREILKQKSHQGIAMEPGCLEDGRKGDSKEGFGASCRESEMPLKQF